jgi:hypothetical protein
MKDEWILFHPSAFILDEQPSRCARVEPGGGDEPHRFLTGP